MKRFWIIQNGAGGRGQNGEGLEKTWANVGKPGIYFLMA